MNNCGDLFKLWLKTTGKKTMAKVVVRVSNQSKHVHNNSLLLSDNIKCNNT